MSTNWKYLAVLLLQLLINIHDCQSRAVSINNTWTLPQDGYSVFYRFFRDKISWFEADAVCQFHHANLVTVDNGIQFDATRAFLKELDVIDQPVWIGLMRPANSKRFLWTNLKPLDPTAGYWAESLPVLEAPLCSVIDPVRDFRWHALRCGGPETAAFLCEMNVPSWSNQCTIDAMPSLTVQYMSDSGTILLSRDCGTDDGSSRHVTCRGKEDRDKVLTELMCDDLDGLAAGENNVFPSERPSTQQKLIVSAMPELGTAPPLVGDYQNTIILSNRINDDNSNSNNDDDTDNNSSSFKSPPATDDELMQGDQPIGDDTANALSKYETTATDDDVHLLHFSNKSPLENRTDDRLTRVVVTTVPTFSVTDETRARRETDNIPSTTHETVEQTTVLTTSASTVSGLPDNTTPSLTIANEMHTTVETILTKPIAHPMHTAVQDIIRVHTASEPHAAVTQHPETTHGDHFIPPMLLVKAKFISTRSHVEQQQHSTTDGSIVAAIASTPKILLSPTAPLNDGLAHILISSSTQAPNEPIQLSTVQPSSSSSSSSSAFTTLSTNSAINTTTKELTSATADTIMTTTANADAGDEIDGEEPPQQHSSIGTRSPFEHSLTNIDNFQPYRPNRRRALTKPDTQSYFKKILG